MLLLPDVQNNEIICKTENVQNEQRKSDIYSALDVIKPEMIDFVFNLADDCRRHFKISPPIL